MATKKRTQSKVNDLYDFALIPKFDDVIKNLSEIADSEDWDYKNNPTTKLPILSNYLKYTFLRIQDEGKISYTTDEQLACWNTGLVTTNQEPIFIVFTKNKFDDAKSPWHFQKFCKLGAIDLTSFEKVPDMAHYFEDPSVLVFDCRKEMRVNVEHIVADNKERFPDNVKSFPEFALQNLLKGAIDSAKERAKRNYKTAIPQYYQGAIQLLLPLSLTDPKIADLALVVENHGDFYRASTCLTLDMAYNNARQLARPDKDWLQP
ncbi:DUF3825 domain-containing protein [Acinetobacter sp. MD2]|uniref:DUF3825 domain-containing protein n=1 Tax=Acinetobacter sp. MD2 TaxID=2600066 RepID=UPI002D1EDE81|nr:DUF3825 domain-containing protein [Acinetobacter sp. MD2]MEB3767554.1 DUF3825 domain-containing protein [Acinetobacter sp. MD2]